MTKKYNVSIPIEKRIILHLADYSHQKDAYEIDTAVTQPGIAKAIDIRMEHVSRSIRGLIKDEFVYSRSAHTKGVHRRKKAYFLSESGMEYAKQLTTWFDNKVLTIRNPNGEIKNIKFYQLENVLKFKIKPLEVFIYSKNSKYGIIDINQLIIDRNRLMEIKKERYIRSGEIKQDTTDFIVSQDLPKLEEFYGREQELKKISTALDSETNFIIVQGIAGIGKTTAILKVIDELRDSSNIFWYQFEFLGSIKHMLKQLSKFLNQLDRRNLFDYFESDSGFDFGDVIEQLLMDLLDINAILVFDDFHRCDKHTEEFFVSLKNLCEKISAPKIIIISRKKQLFYDQRDIAIKKTVQEIKLQGLDLESSKKIIKNDEIGDTQLEHIHECLDGHPIALKLLSYGLSLKKLNDFHSFIEEQIFDELSSQEKEILSLACIFRYPVEPDVLFLEDSSANYDTLRELEKKLLIWKTEINRFYMHELLIDIYYHRLTNDQKVMFHSIAAKYYEGKNEDMEILERIHHLINSKQYSTVAKFVIESGDMLISHGYLELTNYLDKFNQENCSIRELQEILSLKADAYKRAGEWDKALENYKKKLKLLKRSKKGEMKGDLAEVYLKIGDIYKQKGDLDKSIQYNLDTLKMLKKGKNNIELAKIFNELGLNYRLKGDLKKSLKMYKESLKTFQALKEYMGIAITSLNLGRLYEYMGRQRLMLKHFKECIEVSQKCDYNDCAGLALKFIGNHHLTKGESQKAIECFEKSMETFHNPDDIENLIQLNDKLGGLYFLEKEYDNALKYYNNGTILLKDRLAGVKKKRKVGFFDLLRSQKDSSLSLNPDLPMSSTSIQDDKERLGGFYEKIGNLYRIQNENEDAIKYHTKQLEVSNDIKNRLEIAKAYLNLGIDHRKVNDYQTSIKSYNLALENLNAIDDRLGILTVHRNLGKIYELNGDLKNAIFHFNLSLDISKELQYDLGTAKAYRELAKVYFKTRDKKKGDTYIKKSWRLLENIKSNNNSN